MSQVEPIALGFSIVSGTYSSSLSFGDVELPDPEGRACFVGFIDPDYEPVWVRAYTSSTDITDCRIRVLGTTVVVFGSRSGDVRLDGEAALAAGVSDFLSLLDLSDGSPKWTSSVDGDVADALGEALRVNALVRQSPCPGCDDAITLVSFASESGDVLASTPVVTGPSLGSPRVQAGLVFTSGGQGRLADMPGSSVDCTAGTVASSLLVADIGFGLPSMF
ncbi:MAG: hypothetical protein AAF645_12555, partial [Myxococcota bacterium]